MFVVLLIFCFVQKGVFQYVTLKVIDSSESCDGSSIVDYYYSLNDCQPDMFSMGTSWDRYLLNESTIVKFSYDSRTSCRDDPINFSENKTSIIYELNECFIKDLEGKLYFTKYSIFEGDQPIMDLTSNKSEEWCTLDLFTNRTDDGECNGQVLFIDTASSVSFRKGFIISTYLQLEVFFLNYISYYCNESDMLICMYHEEDDEGRPWGLVHYTNFADDECIDRFDKSPPSKFLGVYDPSFKYIRKKSRSMLEFSRSEVEIVTTTTKEWLFYEVFYSFSETTGSCYGLPFLYVRVPLDRCYIRPYRSLTKGLIVTLNETYTIEASYMDGECGGGDGNDFDNLAFIQSGPYYLPPIEEEGKCEELSGILGEMPDEWGYRILTSLETDDIVRRLSILIPFEDCEILEYITIPQALLEIKRALSEGSFEGYFFTEHACIADDWSDFLGFNIKSMRGRCEEGELKGSNYTISGHCENLFIPVEDSFCVESDAFAFVWTCIPPECDGIPEYEDDVCSGHGTCLDFDECVCETGYEGQFCGIGNASTQPGSDYTWAYVTFPILGTTGLILMVVIGVCGTFLCVGCFCFIACTIIAFFFMGGFTSVLMILRMRLNKFSKLRNVDLLLMEQVLEEDSSVAHIKINKSMFEIDFNELKSISMLGEGGSNAVVYRCSWKGMDVAFKCFKTRLLCCTQDSFLEFEKEVEILSSVSHPNIVRFFGCTLAPPRVGIVMEFCPNGDLNEFLKAYRDKNDGIRYPFQSKMRIVVEITSALDYLHSRSIIHRDVKLENVLVDKLERSKVMDFGLSRYVKNNESKKTVRLGTRVYMSPEIVLGESNYTSKTDVFSFGILLWMILTENLHPYGVVEQVELKVANNPKYRPDVHLLESWLPGGYQWISEEVQKCWQHNPSKRKSFGELFSIFQSTTYASYDENQNRGSVRIAQNSFLEEEVNLHNAKTDDEDEDEDEDSMVFVSRKYVKGLEIKIEELEKKFQ